MHSWSSIRITAWVNYQLLNLNSYSDYALIKLCNLGLVVDQSVFFQTFQTGEGYEQKNFYLSVGLCLYNK